MQDMTAFERPSGSIVMRDLKRIGTAPGIKN